LTKTLVNNQLITEAGQNINNHYSVGLNKNVLYIKQNCAKILICLIYNTKLKMDLVEIGQLIARTRKNRKLTQSELASMTGIGRTTLSLIENGMINEIGINKIITLCELLSLEIIIKEKSSRPTLQQLLAEKDNHA
jgi:DNA-binding XRE family transcriptional regulator